MREKLNSNPLVQAAVVGVLLLSAGFFLLSTMGRGGEEEAEVGLESSSPAVVASGEGEVEDPAAALSSALSTVNAAPSDAPPPPRPVVDAWEANQVIVLLFVRNGGIDDELVAGTTRRLGGLPGVSSFVIPARQIFRYAAIAEGVGVERVPALVVVRPKNLDQQLPTASVSYGYQTPQSVVQAVVDAGYKGPTIDYHP